MYVYVQSQAACRNNLGSPSVYVQCLARWDENVTNEMKGTNEQNTRRLPSKSCGRRGKNAKTIKPQPRTSRCLLWSLQNQNVHPHLDAQAAATCLAVIVGVGDVDVVCVTYETDGLVNDVCLLV